MLWEWVCACVCVCVCVCVCGCVGVREALCGYLQKRPWCLCVFVVFVCDVGIFFEFSMVVPNVDATATEQVWMLCVSVRECVCVVLCGCLLEKHHGICVCLLCMCVLWDHICQFPKAVTSVDAYVENLVCVLCVWVCVCVCVKLIVYIARKRPWVFAWLWGLWQHRHT